MVVRCRFLSKYNQIMTKTMGITFYSNPRTETAPPELYFPLPPFFRRPTVATEVSGDRQWQQRFLISLYFSSVISFSTLAFLSLSRVATVAAVWWWSIGTCGGFWQLIPRISLSPASALSCVLFSGAQQVEAAADGSESDGGGW